MAAFTDLNIEQSVAKYVADQLGSAGFKIYWWDSKQTVGSQSIQVTFLREIPEDPAYLVHQSEAQTDTLVKVPAFTVRCIGAPKATNQDRLGIGESIFHWRAEVRLDGFVDDEKQWYDFTKYFQQWLVNPDVRVPLADYHADLSVANPAVLTDYIEFEDCDLRRQEVLIGPDAARYYIQFAATVKYAE